MKYYCIDNDETLEDALGIPKKFIGRGEIMTDSERLDWLEKFINANGAILLHDGSMSGHGFSGLGLRPGCLDRTLRQAIDSCAGIEISLRVPEVKS